MNAIYCQNCSDFLLPPHLWVRHKCCQSRQQALHPGVGVYHPVQKLVLMTVLVRVSGSVPFHVSPTVQSRALVSAQGGLPLPLGEGTAA